MKKQLKVKHDLLPSQIVKAEDVHELISFGFSDIASKVKPRATAKEQIEEAVEDVRFAMLENVKASEALFDAEVKKRKAHYLLQKAKERLHALEQELMQ